MTSRASPSATSDLVRSVARHGWLFALALVPAGVLLFVTPPPASTEVGSATVAVRPAGDARVGELRQFDAYLRRHVETFAQLATTNSVLDPVIADHDLSTTARELAERITIVQPENREIVSFEVAGRDREDTLATTEAIGEALAARIEALSPRDGVGGTLVRATVVGTSVSAAEGERSWLPVGALAALGLLAATAWVLWRFATDDVVRTRGELKSVTNAPILATFSPGESDESGAHLLRLHLDAHRTKARVARLVGTTPSAAEAFEVRDRLLAAYRSTDQAPPHIEVVHPARVAVVPDAVVVAAVDRVTVTRLVQVLCTIEERGGTVAGVIAHVPRRGLARLTKRSAP